MKPEINIVGKVAIGRGVGRQLGFPTLNFEVSKMPQFTGVFAGIVEIFGKKYKAAIFIGKPKTFENVTETVEAHLLGFDGNIGHGVEGKIVVKEKIRDVEKFKNKEELKKAISEDCEKIRQLKSEF